MNRHTDPMHMKAELIHRALDGTLIWDKAEFQLMIGQ